MIGSYWRYEQIPSAITTVEWWGWVYYRVYPDAIWIEYPRW